jgi:hypothetical protein
MPPEMRLTRVILTSPKAQPLFPIAIETVEQAIDHLQELPREALLSQHWRAASRALWSALDFQGDADRLATVDATLCKALKTEGWLNEAGLS